MAGGAQRLHFLWASAPGEFAQPSCGAPGCLHLAGEPTASLRSCLSCTVGIPVPGILHHRRAVQGPGPPRLALPFPCSALPHFTDYLGPRQNWSGPFPASGSSSPACSCGPSPGTAREAWASPGLLGTALGHRSWFWATAQPACGRRVSGAEKTTKMTQLQFKDAFWVSEDPELCPRGIWAPGEPGVWKSLGDS